MSGLKEKSGQNSEFFQIEKKLSQQKKKRGKHTKNQRNTDFAKSKLAGKSKNLRRPPLNPPGGSFEFKKKRPKGMCIAEGRHLRLHGPLSQDLHDGDVQDVQGAKGPGGVGHGLWSGGTGLYGKAVRGRGWMTNECLPGHKSQPHYPPPPLRLMRHG